MPEEAATLEKDYQLIGLFLLLILGNFRSFIVWKDSVESKI